MKIIKLFYAIAIVGSIAVSCKETKKEELKEDSMEITNESSESVETSTDESVEANQVKGTSEADGVKEEMKGNREAEAIETTTKEVEKMAADEGVIIEKFADTPVIYPGCEGGTVDEIRACSIKEFKNFLASNFDKDLSSNFDLDVGEHKIRSLVKIDKTGKVTVRKVVASSVELENEMIRIIGKLPNMTPATKGGSPVDVSFVVPVNFKVEGY